MEKTNLLPLNKVKPPHTKLAGWKDCAQFARWLGSIGWWKPAQKNLYSLDELVHQWDSADSYERMDLRDQYKIGHYNRWRY